MELRTHEIKRSEIPRLAQNYRYALVYQMSDLYLGETSEMPGMDWDECLEARFFDDQREMHIVTEGESCLASEVTDDGSEDVILEEYRLAKRFCKAGSKVCVQKYLSYDEDGMAVVALTRLRAVSREERI